MAQLNIEQKRSHTGIWVVVALVLVALLAWWLFAANDADTYETTRPAATTSDLRSGTPSGDRFALHPSSDTHTTIRVVALAA